MLSYHLARMVSYTVLGMLLGAMGSAAAPLFLTNTARIVPLALAALFIAMAFGFDRKLPQPKLLRRVIGSLHVKSGSGMLLGLVTPLIPCGPLYLMLGVSLISGSWERGATLMACFSAGTMPLYALAQWQWFRLSGRMAPGMLRRTQKVLACASAVLITWRVLANGGLGLGSVLCH